MKPPVPRLLAISDRRKLGNPAPEDVERRRFLDWVARLESAGVDAVQIREKDLTDRRLHLLARYVVETFPRLTVSINGRADIAVAAGAAGVHLPSDGVPVSALRRRFGQDLLIGVSTHYRQEIAAARRDGADYATFGPVFETPGKEAFGPPPGLAGLESASEIGLPLLALGGIDTSRLESVLGAGARGLAAIRAFHTVGETRSLVLAMRRYGEVDMNRGEDGDHRHRN